MTEGTLARLFWERVARHGDRPAQRVKVGGAWTELSWRDLGEEVRELALGLMALGRDRGAAVALLSQSRAEWVRADFAIFSAGCVTIPIYPTYPGETAAYILEDSGAETIFVENEAQLAKVREVAARLPRLHAAVLIQGTVPAEGSAGPRAAGLRVVDWAGLRALGRTRRAELEGELTSRLAAGTAEDVASIVYTSGTTGHPKGVVQTHGNHLAALQAAIEVSEVREGDVHLLFLPLAHVFARFESFLGVGIGLVTAFAESLDKVPENVREVRPDFIVSVPRLFEKIYARILTGVEGGPPLKRRIFHWTVGVGRRVSQHQREGRTLPVGLRLQAALAQRLVFKRVHQALGGRLRFCYSGGAPLAQEIGEFFHALGILILEGYGLTETCPLLTGNRRAAFRFGTVGRPFPRVELRIAEDGEILARAPNIARGYYRRPEETAQAFGPDGWFHTGDIGEIDADGFLRITDRKKDLIKTSGGVYVAPQLVENLLKGDPFISQAMVYGDRRPYPVALITLNPEELAKFARLAGLGDKPSAELVGHPAVTARVGQIVDRANRQLASYAQIKRFVVVDQDFSQEGGELTPTLKVKRREVQAKYSALIEALYQS
ncbi:MAG TPA: long-chain fatty acid--CoA ligase [Methylomirabilota bacterium]|nr:long-chain fatty acid--CoA ligase [Methylomirabilota bacterium]